MGSKIQEYDGQFRIIILRAAPPLRTIHHDFSLDPAAPFIDAPPAGDADCDNDAGRYGLREDAACHQADLEPTCMATRR
jgi:hypothetical protein